MSIKLISRISLIILPFIIVFLAIIPLLSSGFFSMHDNVQVERLFDLNQALRAGQFPVRIIPNLGFGYGYVLFNFYPPFVYYFGEIFKLLGFSFIASIKATIFFGFLLSYVFMYLFSKEYWGRLGGILSATIYLYAPYHAVDVYVRGAIPEFWSFVFLPAIFWSMTKFAKTKSDFYLILLSISGALLVLSHDLVAIMSIPFIFIYFLFLLSREKDKKSLFIKTAFSGVLSALLSAFFWLPAVLEKGYTMVNLLTIEKASYSIHFVCIRQFVSNFWGYSGSVPGCLDGLSLSLGQLQVGLLAISIPVIIYLLIKRKKELGILVLFLIFLVFSLFIQTKYSVFIWDHIQPLSYIQFPWRFLLFSSFFLSFIVGSLSLVKISEKIKIVILLFLILLTLFVSRNIFKPEKMFTDRDDNFYTNTEHIRWDASMLFAEYSPSGIKTKTSEFDTTVVDINENTIARSVYSVVKGKMDIKVLSDLPQKKELSVATENGGVLRLNTFYFPGWKVTLDGKEIAYNASNPLKLITFNIPSGTHSLSAIFTNTVVRSVANIASLTGLLLIVAFSLAIARKKKVNS